MSVPHPSTRGGVTEGGSERPGPGPGPRVGFTVSRAGGTVVVTVRGPAGVEEWSRIDAVLRDLIDAQGNLDVVVDLGEVDRLEHEAVPLIVQAAQQAHRHGGRLRLADRACRDHARGPVGQDRQVPGAPQ